MAVTAGLAEFIGGLLFALGFLTPLAALAIIGTMIIAISKGSWTKWFLGNAKWL